LGGGPPDPVDGGQLFPFCEFILKTSEGTVGLAAGACLADTQVQDFVYSLRMEAWFEAYKYVGSPFCQE